MRLFPSFTLGRGLLLFGAAIGLLVAGCDPPSPPARETQKALASVKSPPQATNPGQKASSAPETHLETHTSAYGSRVFPFGKELLVTTATRLYRVKPGKAVQEVPALLGDAPTLHEGAIAFFRDGKVRTLSLLDHNESVRFAVDHYVQYLLSSGARLTWLSHEREGRYFLQTESVGAAETLYESKNELIWPVLHDETIYFIERIGSAWKLGRAPLDGSGVTFGKEHQSRVPTMLAPGPEGLFLYDGPKEGVRKIDYSLTGEASFARNVICSPLSVSTRVLCAQVGSVYELARAGADPRPVAQETGGPIAHITATDERVYWVVDRGPDRMEVRSAPLREL